MNYEKIIQYRNETNAFANLIGLKITEMDKGYCKTYMPINGDGFNPIDSVHGGAIFTVGDVTGGGAASSYGYQVTTVSASINYLRAGLDTTELVGKAREIKAGKRLMTYDVEIMDQHGTILAEGIFSYMSLGKVIAEDVFE